MATEEQKMSESFSQEEAQELIAQRYALAVDRIGEMKEEHLSDTDYDAYFHCLSDFLLMMDDTCRMAAEGRIADGSLEMLRQLNHRLYEDILPENYDRSYANPVMAVQKFGEERGRLLSCLYYEMRSLIPHAFEAQVKELTIRMELFLEVYGAFCNAQADRKDAPSAQEIREILYWFYSDYAEEERQLRFGQMVAPDEDYARNLIMNSDLKDPAYLYRFGEYITDNELETAELLNQMSEEEAAALAHTYTEGYRIGFEVTGKDIHKKKTVSIRYGLGFERMIRHAVLDFEKIGLQSSVYRALPSLFHTANSTYRNGYCGASANKQYEYDHKDDDALFMDAAFLQRRLEAVRSAGEMFKAQAAVFGGPAVVETFGEKPFSPVIRKEAVHLSPAQEKMLSEYRGQAAMIQNEYIHEDERSFTIIAFPVAEIGAQYKEIFSETVRLNTLDYELYQKIQQVIIDTLDKASYCLIRGMGDNHTQMKVALHHLSDPEKETNFENCVADVNIPVGEVFTSPVLKGTEGVLHVTQVYLEGLLFKNLEIHFSDGCISGYSCSNFDTDVENRKYIEDNILYHHDTLPLGEIAIGTNTTAYVMAHRYHIADKMPILIAEKTGPHFAVGDTCYSHEEDNITFNPDGKQIIARSNEISDLRKAEPEKAYFNCHTDITIPYNELGEVSAVTKDGTVIPVILKGRFVLEGTQELNKPLDEE